MFFEYFSTNNERWLKLKTSYLRSFICTNSVASLYNEGIAIHIIQTRHK